MLRDKPAIPLARQYEGFTTTPLGRALRLAAEGVASPRGLAGATRPEARCVTATGDLESVGLGDAHNVESIRRVVDVLRTAHATQLGHYQARAPRGHLPGRPSCSRAA
jgi:hypothetical protein